MRESGEERMRRYEEALKRVVSLTIPTSKIAGSGRVQIPGVGEIRISGSGFISQDEIKIMGSGRLPGGLRVGKLRASGSLRVDGDIEAEEGKFSGSTHIEGSVRAGRLKASGSIEVGGEALGGMMKLSGSSRIDGRVELEDSLISHGSLMAGGDVKAGKRVELRAAFEIEGEVFTRVFEAELRGSESHIKGGIRAEEINIYRGEGAPWKRGRLQTTDIMGKRIRLESVICENITGGEIYIGEGCEVRGMVRYWDSLEIHPKARLRHPPTRIEAEGD